MAVCDGRLGEKPHGLSCVELGTSSGRPVLLVWLGMALCQARAGPIPAYACGQPVCTGCVSLWPWGPHPQRCQGSCSPRRAHLCGGAMQQASVGERRATRSIPAPQRCSDAWQVHGTLVSMSLRAGMCLCAGGLCPTGSEAWTPKGRASVQREARTDDGTFPLEQGRKRWRNTQQVLST